MRARIACGQNIAARAPRPALPIGQNTACAFNNGNQRRNVPMGEARFHDQIDKAHGQQRVGVTIAAITRQTADVFHPRENLACVIGKMRAGMGGGDHRLGGGPRAPYLRKWRGR